MPSHYLNQCWIIVNWTLRNKLLWNFNQNTKLFIPKMHLKISFAKWRPFCREGDDLKFLPHLPGDTEFLHQYPLRLFSAMRLARRSRLPPVRCWLRTEPACPYSTGYVLDKLTLVAQSRNRNVSLRLLTHWGRVTHICVGNLTIIGSDKGLSPSRRQAIIWTNAGILLIGPLGTNLSEILIEMQIFSFKNMHLKMSSGKRCPFCLGLNVFSG